MREIIFKVGIHSIVLVHSWSEGAKAQNCGLNPSSDKTSRWWNLQGCKVVFHVKVKIIPLIIIIPGLNNYSNHYINNI